MVRHAVPDDPAADPPAAPIGPATWAEPAHRGRPWRRALAWAVDFGVVLTVAVLLGILTFHRIGGLVTDVPGLATRSAWEIVSSRGDLAETAGGLGRSVWASAVRAVQQGFAGLVLFAFLYRFVALVTTGRTLGMAVAGLRAVPRPRGGAVEADPQRLTRGRAAVRAGVSTVADVGCYALACSLLVAGSLVLSVLCWAVAVVLFCGHALCALVGPGRSLGDRAAGTAVTSVWPPRDAARGAAEEGRAA